MVKKNIIFLLILLVFLLPSFALEPRIIQQGEFFEEEELELLNEYLAGLETVYDIETAAFLLENPSELDFTDYLGEAYEFKNPRYVYFAYDIGNSTYHGVSDGIDELGGEELQTIVDSLAGEDHPQAFSLVRGFFLRASNYLAQGLDKLPPEMEETPSQGETLIGEKYYFGDRGLLWTDKEFYDLARRVGEMAEGEDIFLAIESIDDPSVFTADYLGELLDEFYEDRPILGLVINVAQKVVEVGSRGGEDLKLDSELEDSLANTVFSKLEEGSSFLAISSYLEELEVHLSQGPVSEEDLAPSPISPIVLSSSLVYLEDLAGLWGEDGAEVLFEKAKILAEEHEIFVTLATTRDSRGKSSEAYIDDLADEKFGINTDNVAFLIDMQNRRIHISTSGRAIDILTDSKIETMLDHAFDRVSEEDYFGAAEVFMKDVDKYFVKAGPNKITGTDALAGLGAGSAGGLSFFNRTKKRYSKKARPLPFQYTNNLIGGIRPSQGALINRRVTTRTISSSSGGSRGGGGSSTHTSSGGGTHGGGGRSF